MIISVGAIMIFARPKSERSLKILCPIGAPLTKARLKALKIICENAPIRARLFAERMWPDSIAWRRRHNGGNGCQIGKGMWLCGGSYLRRLEKDDLVEMDYYDWSGNLSIRGFVLTKAGRRALRLALEKEQE